MRATRAGDSLASASAFLRVLAGDSGVPASTHADLVVTLDVVVGVDVESVDVVVAVVVDDLKLPQD